MHPNGPPRSTGHLFTSSTPYGPVQLQVEAGVALLRGAGATTTKSAPFLFVSSKAGEEQLSFRFAALAALSGSAGMPSQAVLDPYERWSRMVLPVGHSIRPATPVLLTNITLPAVAFIEMLPVTSGVGR